MTKLMPDTTQETQGPQKTPPRINTSLKQAWVSKLKKIKLMKFLKDKEKKYRPYSQRSEGRSHFQLVRNHTNRQREDVNI